MTFEQFKKILNLSERLTGIQYSVSTRQEVMDLCNEFYDDSIQYGVDDDHYYAILKDGSYTSDHDGGCKQSSLKTAKKITFTSDWGTVWFFGRESQKDEQLLDNEFEAEILIHIEDYISEDSNTAEEIIKDLENAIEDDKKEDSMIGLKKTDERVEVVENPYYCEFDDDSVEFFENVESWYDIDLDGVKIGSCIVMEYHDEAALLERLDIDEQYRCKGHGTEAIEVLKRIRSEKDGFLYCAAESERCSHLYDRIGRRTSEDPWCSLDQGFGVFCLG